MRELTEKEWAKVDNLVDKLECSIDEEITNKERTIMFTSGGERFELTLIQKRKPKT